MTDTQNNADDARNQGDRPMAKRCRESRGWGPFSGAQLTIVIVAVALVLLPTAAMAAVGTFTSTTVTPAVTGTNSATVANAKGVQGSASATSAGVTRYGVTGNAGGTFGIGVQGTGTKYGVFSNGPLGVAAGKSLSCTGCVGVGALSNAAGRTRAYAYVDGNGTVEASRSRNIAIAVFQPGLYCVAVSNIAASTIAPVVSVSDTAWTAAPWSAVVSFDSAELSLCPAGFQSFIVGLQKFDAGTFTAASHDFTIVIP
jgi:hypothetical protein